MDVRHASLKLRMTPASQAYVRQRGCGERRRQGHRTLGSTQKVSLCFSVSESCLPRERMVENVLITGLFECLNLTSMSKVNGLCK